MPISAVPLASAYPSPELLAAQLAMMIAVPVSLAGPGAAAGTEAAAAGSLVPAGNHKVR